MSKDINLLFLAHKQDPCMCIKKCQLKNVMDSKKIKHPYICHRYTSLIINKYV